MTTAIVPLYKYFNKKIKGFWNITRLAKERRIFFTNQEKFGDNAIALDTAKKKLFYLCQSKNRQSCLIIDLKDLDSCTIKKQYNSINAGDLKKKKLHEFLESIMLNLRFKNRAYTIAIPFFDAKKDKWEEVQHLEAKAEVWQSIVSRMLPAHIGERA